jgi:hypothetical protein
VEGRDTTENSVNSVLDLSICLMSNHVIKMNERNILWATVIEINGKISDEQQKFAFYIPLYRLRKR